VDVVVMVGFRVAAEVVEVLLHLDPEDLAVLARRGNAR